MDTFGTPLHHLKSDAALVVLVLTLLAYGCPTQAIVHAYNLDERTVGDWLWRAGQHGKAVQEALLCQERLDLGQVQADELCVRVRGGHVWLATVMTVASRMLLWGAVSRTRDTALIGSVVAQVRRMTRLQSPLLWATDGLGTWATQIGRVFREKVMTGRRGRPRLLPWAELQVTQVVKRFGKGRVGRVERRLACGDLFEALKVIRETQGTWGTFNTAYVERLNATLRTWIPALTRRSRHAGTEGSVEGGGVLLGQRGVQLHAVSSVTDAASPGVGRTVGPDASNGTGTDRPEVDGRGGSAISPSSAPHGTPRCRVALPGEVLGDDLLTEPPHLLALGAELNQQ